MGVRFGREYDDIIHDLSAALQEVDGFYEAFEMDGDSWGSLEKDEQRECVRTLADDIFFGLGMEPMIQIGRGMIQYDIKKHVITVGTGDQRIHVVYLT